MAISEENVNNVDKVGAQSYLASTSTIKKGSNDIAFINILSWTNGALQTQTIQLVEDAPEPKLGEAKFSIPSDQLIIEAIQQLEVDTNATPNSYQIDKTEYFEVPNTIFKEFIIEGTIIDYYKNVPLPNVSILLPLPGSKLTTKTNSFGKFKIKATFPINKDTEVVTLRPPILVTAGGYIPKKLNPYALDQTIRTNLGTTQLQSTQGLTDEAKNKIAALKAQTIAIIRKLKPRKISLKILIKKFIKILKEQIIPYALKLIQPFLIGKLIDILTNKLSLEDAQGPCPAPEEVEKAKIKRNRIVRQLNSIYKIVNTALVVVGILGGLSAVIKVAAGIIRSIPLPTAVPPGVGFPTSVILNFQKLIDKLLVYAEKVFTFSIGISAALLVLSQLLLSFLKLLGILDQQLLRCSVDDAELEDLAFNLEDLASEEVTNEDNNLVNGFTLKVIPVKDGTVGSISKRRAIAIDSRGVTVLKGDKSFSASEQVLKDELAFYIRSNNLKAN